MKLKKWTALALSAALATCMLTGCPWEENEESSDDASSTPGTSQGGGENTGGSTGGGTEEGNPDSGEEEPSQPVEYTFTVSVNVPDGYEAPTRGFIQILNSEDSGVKTVQISGNNATCTTSLLPNQEYTCLFWADTAKGNDPTDLTKVTYKPNTAAYAAKITGKPNEITNLNITVNLQPVTTKVSIEFTGNTSEPATVTYPYATTYNVQSEQATSPDTETVEFNQENAAAAQLSAAPRLVQALGRLSRASDSNTCTFYTLLPNNGETEVSIKHDNLVYTTDLKAENPVIDLGNLEDKDENEWKAAA